LTTSKHTLDSTTTTANQVSNRSHLRGWRFMHQYHTYSWSFSCQERLGQRPLQVPKKIFSEASRKATWDGNQTTYVPDT